MNKAPSGGNSWRAEASQDDLLSLPRMLELCKRRMSPPLFSALTDAVAAARARAGRRTAWRVEGTLREFARFPPRNLWFEYPVHLVDADGLLADAGAEGEKCSRAQAIQSRKRQTQDEWVGKINALEQAIAEHRREHGGPPTVKDLAERMKQPPRTLRDWINGHSDYKIDRDNGGAVVLKASDLPRNL